MFAPPPPPHSDDFLEARDAIFELSDEERLALARWLETTPTGGPALNAALIAIHRLSESDQYRLRRWVVRYVNQWGQIPYLASHRASRNLEQSARNS